MALLVEAAAAEREAGTLLLGFRRCCWTAAAEEEEDEDAMAGLVGLLEEKGDGFWSDWLVFEFLELCWLEELDSEEEDEEEDV